MGQSARSFQGNYLSTFPDACQYLKALCRLRIPRFAFSGSRVSEEARPLPKDHPKRTTKSRSRRAVVRFPASKVLRSLPGCAPTLCARAPRQGPARQRQSWGVRTDQEGPESASRSMGEPSQQLATRGGGKGSQGSGSSSGGPAQGAGGVPG